MIRVGSVMIEDWTAELKIFPKMERSTCAVQLVQSEGDATQAPELHLKKSENERR